MEALTAAHPTLPFGTLVRVENLETGDRVRVRINDRGPFVGGRILDVSRRAARELGLLEPGVGRVRVEVLNTPDPVRCWQVQVGAFAERSSAEEARRRIEANGPRARVLEAVGGEHRLWVGPFPDRPEAERVARDENGILVGC
jgi:rare lipoprotein A